MYICLVANKKWPTFKSLLADDPMCFCREDRVCFVARFDLDPAFTIVTFDLDCAVASGMFGLACVTAKVTHDIDSVVAMVTLHLFCVPALPDLGGDRLDFLLPGNLGGEWPDFLLPGNTEVLHAATGTSDLGPVTKLLNDLDIGADLQNR